MGVPLDVPETVYRKDVSEVRLTFYATDQNNDTVTGIAKSDLAVVDSDEVIRNIRSLSRSENTKLDVVLLIDCSDSVLPRFRRELTDVVQIMSQSHWFNDDHVSVISFCGSAPAMVDGGSAQDLIRHDHFLPVNVGGNTPLYDAIDLAGRFLESRRDPETRAAILLFSDGMDTISRSSAAEALDRILKTETQVYSIDLDSKHPSNGTRMLHTLAESTGGIYLRIEDGAPKLISAVIDDLHSAYLLTYDLPNHRPGYHSVRLLPTHNRNLRFRCRQGYFYGNDNR